MKRIVKRFGDLRFRNKLVFSTLFVALIPLLLFSIVIGTVLVQDVSRISGQLTLQVVEQTSESLDVYIGTIEKLMNLMIDEGSSAPVGDEAQNRALQEIADSILRAYPEIAGIAVAYADDSYVGAGMTRISRNLFADEEWYQYALSLDGQLGVIGNAVGRNVVGNLNDSSDSIFSLVKAFSTEGSGETRGVVLFDIRHDMIEQLINRVSIGDEGFLYVVDDSDIVYTPSSSIVYRIDEACYEQEGVDTDTVRDRQAGLFHRQSLQRLFRLADRGRDPGIGVFRQYPPGLPVTGDLPCGLSGAGHCGFHWHFLYRYPAHLQAQPPDGQGRGRRFLRSFRCPAPG